MKTWKNAFLNYLNPKIFIFLFLGFACGLPYNLLGYSLTLWMRQVGVSLAVIGFFSLVFLPYSLKFLWAPFIDKIRIPYLAHVGHKKAWGLIFQMGLILSIIGLAYWAPDMNSWTWHRIASNGQMTPIPVQTFIFAFLTAFFASSQDIVVDALRIDTLEKEEMGEGASTYQLGYRLALLTSGAGVVVASSFISWQLAYVVVGLLCFMGMVSLLFVKEPPRREKKTQPNAVFKEMVLSPFIDFMRHHNWLWILVFIILYKVCNAVLGRMAIPFYSDIGFTKTEIALISGLFGPWITIFGVFIGGALVARFNVLKCLLWLGFIEIGTSCAFALLAFIGASVPVFVATIIFDNVIGGMGGAVFIAFLSGLCSREHSATQYALLTSLMAIASSVIASSSGLWAETMGWTNFFLFSGLLMIPALVLLTYLMKTQKRGQENEILSL